MIKNFFYSHDTIIDRFASFLKNDRLAHAYLFVGPDNIGKQKTAQEVAKLVNCENLQRHRPCDTCADCIKINRSLHPDIHVVANREVIKIDDIRILLRQIQLRSFQAKKKVFILSRVEVLTLEAANALLKTLEEPSFNSLLLLTTSIPNQVLTTIKSRCQSVYFFPLSPQYLKKKIRDAGVRNDEIAHFLAHALEGGFAQPVEENFQKFFQHKNRIIDEFLFFSNNERYFKDIARDRQKTKEALWVLFCWFKDLLSLQCQASEKHLTHLDRVKDLQKMKEEYSLKRVTSILQDIANVFRAADEKFNIKISLALLKENIWTR